MRLNDPLATIIAMKAGQPPNIVAVLERIEQRARDGVNFDAMIGLLTQFIDGIGGMPEDGPADVRKCFPDGILACYKARPLNGIWATAPYLHNGSVRTMRQLLLPAADRQTTFRVGSREFDPVNMGFEDAGASTLDTALPGNSNEGHDGPIYGNRHLKDNPSDLDALIEYLKTL